MTTCHLGLDVGSTTIKLVDLDDLAGAVHEAVVLWDRAGRLRAEAAAYNLPALALFRPYGILTFK